jgi:inosose dehydratase
MTLVGGFVPLVLQDREQWADSVERAKVWADTFAYCGADRFVTALVQDYDWSRPTPPDRDTMKVIGEGMRLIDEVCESFGILQTFHPHVGTLVETKPDFDLALEETSSKWCLDTGHFAIGGVDPVQFAKDHADRIGHAHLKDVNMALASQVLSGEITLLKAVQERIFVPFGTGDVNIADAVVALEERGYTGRYVLEQDTAVMGQAPAAGEGPIDDVRICLDYLAREVEPRLATVSA